MLTVHHLGISQSDRVVWLCEELQVPYELVRYERDAVTRLAPAAYRALHPIGTAPVISDAAVTLAESGACLEYVARRYGDGRFIPDPRSNQWPDYLFWFHFANASLMPASIVELMLNLVDGGSSNAPMVKAMQSRADTAFQFIDERLGRAPYFAGDDFTLADIIMLFPLTTMRAFVPRSIAELHHLRAYLEKISQRPAYRSALAKGDPGFSPPMS